METFVYHALELQRPAIRNHWESLLRLERITSPLAQPDLLVHLLDRTLDDIFATLQAWPARRHCSQASAAVCPCGRNPLLAYYTAGHQALREALVMIQASSPSLTGTERDATFTCLDQVFRHIAQREIAAFCALCQFRHARSPGQTLASASGADRPFRRSARDSVSHDRRKAALLPRGGTPG